MNAALIQPGDNAIALALAMPQLVAPKIAEFAFNMYVPKPGVEQRLAKPAAGGSVPPPPASNLRDLWDRIMTELTNADDVDEVFKKLLSHDPKDEIESKFPVAAADLSWQLLEGRLASMAGIAVLALSSECRLADGTVRHIPMIDFHCPPSARNASLVFEAMKSLGQKRGAILESGRSYHYCGFETLSAEEWREFLGKALLLAPLTDARYIAHRLIAGACALRITSSGQKPKTPRLIKLLAE